MEEPISNMSSKGQVTIPQEVRHRMGLQPGDKVKFGYKEGDTIIKPVRVQKSSFSQWAGAYPVFETAEERAEWLSDLRDDEDRKDDLRSAPR